MVVVQWLSQFCLQNFKLLLTIALVILPFSAIAESDKSKISDESKLLQTEISLQDLRIIEQLVTIAQRNSAQVQETKAAMGLGSFLDVVAIEELAASVGLSPQAVMDLINGYHKSQPQ